MSLLHLFDHKPSGNIDKVFVKKIPDINFQEILPCSYCCFM